MLYHGEQAFLDEGQPGHCGPRRIGPKRPRWEFSYMPEQTSLLALRRTKRHLEARRADLEDQIQALEKLIAKHPDNNP